VNLPPCPVEAILLRVGVGPGERDNDVLGRVADLNIGNPRLVVEIASQGDICDEPRVSRLGQAIHDFEGESVLPAPRGADQRNQGDE
jgi:hypothetical protein